VPPAYAELFRDHIHGARLKTIPAAGHVLAAEKPLELARAIVEFAA
jgi:pimeloyl-ACP methyl ester carboxylesterase